MIIWEPGHTLEMAEKIIIEQAFKFYRGNKTQTAQSLDIAIRTLDNKLELYDKHRIEAERKTERLLKERELFITRQRGQFQAGQGLSSPEARVSMESTHETTVQSEVSLSERSQVQEVLPRQAAKGHSRKSG